MDLKVIVGELAAEDDGGKVEIRCYCITHVSHTMHYATPMPSIRHICHQFT